MDKAITRRAPWLVALLLAIAAQTLFGWGVTRVDHIVFDETHYVPAAQHIARLDTSSNIEHPLVGKTLIAAGIKVVGDYPLGWRLPGTIAGTLAVLGVFALTLTLFGSTATAACAALLAMLNGMLYVQARIAMPDVFLCAFVVWGLAFAAMAVRGGKPVDMAILAGVSLGLATGTKWMAAPFVAVVCVGYLWTRRRDIHLATTTGRTTADAVGDHMGGKSAWGLALATGLAAVLTYFVSFWPAFLYADNRLTGIGDLLSRQMEMYRLQTQVLAPHTYQSGWGTWPFLLRPVWYLFEDYYGGQRCILMLANPATAAMGLLGTAIAIARWWRTHDQRQALAAGMWLFAWGVFALIPKSIGFAYYFVPASLLLAVATAGALHRLDGRARGAMIAAVGIAALGFAWFLPVYSGGRLEIGAYERLMWLDSWR
jgi:dolichyl-phosphate-mannose-protein mannosyltransferase